MSRSKDLNTLQEEWYRRLKAEGFEDVEDSWGYLKHYDHRTIAWQHRTRIQAWFIRLDHFLTAHEDLPEPDRTVLLLYTEGKYLKVITQEVKLTLWAVTQIIKKYKRII